MIQVDREVGSPHISSAIFSPLQKQADLLQLANLIDVHVFEHIWGKDGSELGSLHQLHEKHSG